MGSFYGNITNTSKTQFQFDKIYPNRYEMEKQKSTDGIYAGRYVLIEYDSDYQQDDFYRVWIFGNKLYNTKIEDPNYLIRLGNSETSNSSKKMTTVPAGTIVFTADDKTSAEGGYYYTNIKYYQITDEKSADGHASFKEIIGKVDDPNYTINYNIDISTYGTGRGYDSTVWQKAYIGGYEKYIMIAELNSVVPTFDVSADAPTVEPLVPHFDTQSTDIYYKLHWQPSWGFRVAEGQGETGEDKKTTSEDGAVGTYPSDVDVSYNISKYDSASGKNEVSQMSYPGAIFFNKAGLDETIHNEYNGDFKNTNEIFIQPTGISGNQYNVHNGINSDVKAAPDIQEIKVLLPSLGNTICAAWDKVYGYDSDSNKRHRDLEWKDAIDTNVEDGKLKKFEGLTSPIRDSKWEKTELGGKSHDPETLAGCINLAHDLLGMILTSKKGFVANQENYALRRIFFDKNKEIDKKESKYYRIYRYPLYEKVNVSEIIALDPGEFSSDQKYNAEFEKRINKILDGYADEDWYLVIAENGGETGNWQVQHFNKKALTAEVFNGEKKYPLAHIARLPNGDIRYGYQWQEIKGFATDLSTINGLILELRNLIESDDSETRNRETVQGTINTLNDIINIFEDLVPGEFLICDANGHVNSANWTTEQDYSYNNIGDSTGSLAESNENQWIKIDLDENKRLISVTHQAHKVEDTENRSDMNGSSDVISLYSPIVDNTGHIVGNHTEIVTLPYGFKYVQPDSYNNTVVDATSNTEKIEADNTQDNLLVGNSNKWIKISTNPNTDTLSIGHEVHSFADQAEANKYYGLEQDESVASLDNDNTFEVPCLKFDEAGHITGARTHTVVLPDNFKSIIVSASTQEKSIGSSMAGIIEADTMEDTLTFAEGDHWINLAADKNNDTITISHAAPGTQTGATKVGEETPKFGGTITIPEVKYDKTGHITSVGEHTATIPLPSLNNVTADGAIVLTGLSMVAADGAITQTNANVGTLKLTGYSKGTNEAVAANDTINAAFGKLQAHIESTDANLSTEITDRKTAISQEVIDRNAAIDKAIGDLDVESASLAANQTIGSWSEADGKISIVPQSIKIADANISDNAAITMSKINGLEDALEGKESKGEAEKVKTALLGGAEATNTIKTLLEAISSLNAEIAGLKTRISALENKDSGA